MPDIIPDQKHAILFPKAAIWVSKKQKNASSRTPYCHFSKVN
jgi:hypothetical protein